MEDSAESTSLRALLVSDDAAMLQRHRGLVHDLNNALSTVLLHVGLLRDELRASGAGAQDLDAIAEAGLRAAEITFQLAIRP